MVAPLGPIDTPARFVYGLDDRLAISIGTDFDEACGVAPPPPGRPAPLVGRKVAQLDANGGGIDRRYGEHREDAIVATLDEPGQPIPKLPEDASAPHVAPPAPLTPPPPRLPLAPPSTSAPPSPRTPPRSSVPKEGFRSCLGIPRLAKHTRRPTNQRRRLRTSYIGAATARSPPRTPMMPLAVEHELFRDADVTVTTSRVVIRRTTYALANITSVRMKTENERGAAIACTVVLGLVTFAMRDSSGVAIPGLMTLVCAVAAILWRAKYWIVIGTAGSEMNAIYSRNRDWTIKVEAAINTAIIARG